MKEFEEKKLKPLSPTTEKPDFLGDVVIKDRPEIKVVSLNGKGDPMKTFDETVGKVLAWLKSKGIKPSKAPTLGIYYKNRAGFGVEKNVEWDACVPVEEIVEAEGNIKYQVLPKRTVSSVTLTGDYDLIGPALSYMEKITWENGIQTEWPLTEVYIKEGGKPVTELQYFLK